MEKRATTIGRALVAAVMLVPLWTAAAATVSPGQVRLPATAPGALAPATAAPWGGSLSGRWELNRWACDPKQSPHDLPARGRGRSILSGPSQEEMRRVTQPESVLVIARQAAHFTVTDDHGHVMLLRTDGVKVKAPEAWPALDRTTKWEGRALVTEVKLNTGARVTQTYTTEDEGFRLVVMTKIQGGHAINPLTYKWVYDLALQ